MRLDHTFKKGTAHRRKFGVEVEAEFDNVEGSYTACRLVDQNIWGAKNDYSLRGASSVEVVSVGEGFSRLTFNYELPKLMGTLSKCGMVETPRASTHIHINMCGATMRVIANFLALYYLIEDNLSKCVGNGLGRVGNMFCLRLSDAEALSASIKSALDNNFRDGLKEEVMKYSALNLYTMYKFGTLEYRVLMTERDCSKVLDCMRLFVRMLKTAERFNAPNEIIEYGSFYGYNQLCKEMVVPSLVNRGMSLDVDYESVLNMQHIFYSLDME